MVTIDIIMEGGLLPNIKLENDNRPEIAAAKRAYTRALDDTFFLRQNFAQLFEGGLTNKNVRVNCTAAGPDKQAVKFFKNSDKAYLLIDMEGKKETRPQRLIDLGLDKASSLDRVFFMVQKMEAWILSQPTAIEKCFEQYQKPKAKSILDDKSLVGKHAETIANPDQLLRVILKRYFEKRLNGKTVKIEYGKLKDAPKLIQLLDIQQLRKDFDEIEKLLQSIDSV